MRQTLSCRPAIKLQYTDWRGMKIRSAPDMTLAGGMRVDWRTIAALWGAGLSTLLALSSIKWPFVSFEPGRPPTKTEPRIWIRVRIINPSKRSLVIVGTSQFQRWRRSDHIKYFHE